MALSESFSSGGKSTRCSSPWMRRMGGLPVDKCRSEAFCSNIKLKNASIFAIHSVLSTSVAEDEWRDKFVTEIARILRETVQREGTIPFVQFMDLALYCPEIGYYERSAIGRSGDFYT